MTHKELYSCLMTSIDDLFLDTSMSLETQSYFLQSAIDHATVLQGILKEELDAEAVVLGDARTCI